MTCKICARPVELFAQAQVLRSHLVSYYRCPNCGFVQTEAPYWLEDAYMQTAVADVGLIGRNLNLSRRSQAVIHAFFDPSARFLDYGGGYGLFVRIMRDRGFDFYLYDKYSTNLFAEGLDVDLRSRDQFELITSFEVFEHLVDPLTDIEEMLKFSDNILFSTALVPYEAPKPTEWWYYALDSGQHVSLYSRESLTVIAQRLQLRLYSNDADLHMFTRKKLSKLSFRLVSKYTVASLLGILQHRKSLAPGDYRRLTGRVL